jgi:SAM-dependent methyltransferase
MATASSTVGSLRAAASRERKRTRELEAWLGSLRVENGIRLVSHPVHFGGNESGEQGYAAQFVQDAALEARIGQAIASVLAIGDTTAPALELGAGTGIFSRPLVMSTAFPQYFITDTSPEFLRGTRTSIDQLGLGKQVQYVVLSGDELGRWPERTVSLVALRYTLHHVLDWERFIHVAARLLVPGGVLMFEEPCADGFVLQAAMADVMLHSPVLRRKMPGSVRRDLEFMVATTLYYARTDVDKSTAEDKHVFPVFRLLDVCREAQLVPQLYPNQGFDGGLNAASNGCGTFAAEFRHNLAVNFGFRADTLEFFDRHIDAACRDIDPIDPRGGGPIVKAVVVARKPRLDAPLLRAGTIALRAISRRIAQASPAEHSDRPAEPRPALQEGFQLTLEYPPSAAPGPRWGHGRAAHQKLRDVFESYEHVYVAQLELIAGFAGELRAIERSDPDPRQPSWINGFLPGLDCAALYTFLRSRAPRRYLEVGAGTSTKFAARARRDGRLDTVIISIDPPPRAEVDALCDVVIRQPFETASVEIFRELQSGDMVFFDGSHRTFTNSDVTVFFLDVLPSLPTGTLVGIHDVFLPDDYPPQWNDRYYSEQYLLAAYLLAGCAWLDPILAAWYVSARPDLGGRLQSLWEDPRLEGVQRHGCALWMQIGARANGM